MAITVASWNIEKNGQSSDFDKQSLVSNFIDVCCNGLNSVDILFLCEVHSARINDYLNYLRGVYLPYNVTAFPGGNSNAYIILTKKELGDPNTIISFDTLKGLNRAIVLVNANGIWLAFAHFKSGQTGLTKDQLFNAATFLNDLHRPGNWAILGDMNWDMSKVRDLGLPFEYNSANCWRDGQTQRSGGLLDWCLTGKGIRTAPYRFNSKDEQTYDMQGPDHRPIIFSFSF